MISSSSSSSSGEESDCIVISEDEESEPEEDPGNSGMHTNDLYNVPDEQGRVLINVGHSENEEDVFLAPQIARIIKPHQVRFFLFRIYGFNWGKKNGELYFLIFRLAVSGSCLII